MILHLTKNDFSRWMICPTAAYYGWSGLESKNENDPFLAFLAEEGRTVERMAHRLFADAELIEERNTKRADQITRVRLRHDCTLFESCIIEGDLVVRPDVLIRKDNTLYIVEVKSKVGNQKQHREGRMLINMHGDVRAAFKEIVYDLAFQVEVLRRAFHDLTIVPYFILPEEQSRSSNEEVAAARNEEQIPFTDVDEDRLKARRSKSVLKFFPAGQAIEKIRPTTSATMDAMAEAWKSGAPPTPRLRYGCRNCEFRIKGGECKDGFHRCWNTLAKPKPHIFDLHQLYQLKTPENKQLLLADLKIQQGKTSLFDIGESDLHGDHAVRQLMQLNCLKTGKEWIDPRLADEIAKLQWPIAFFDCETTMAAIPWHSEIKPYETLPFQFSVHILHADGTYEHKEWLNVEDRIPTFPFIQNLRESLAGVGSVLIFTDYEIRILNEAVCLLKRLHHDESFEEREWIADLLNSGRIVDQHDWVYRYHMHPKMNGGRSSIKVALPAVWRSNPALHRHEYFSRYHKEADGEVIDPYKTLPDLVVDGQIIEVREGCGAMKAYREMIIGRGATCSKTKESIATLLRNYVTLDTASQWILFQHCCEKLQITPWQNFGAQTSTSV